jgi:ATP-binding cassette subfamily B protein
MKEIGKILRKYTIEIIVVITLLFIQAKCDLILPEYTSNIVNIGIQQSGIEYAVPEVIRENEFNKVLFFIDENNIGNIKDNYELIEKGDKKYVDKYPLLSKENLYIFKSGDNVDYESLSDTLALPLMLASNMSKMDASAIPNIPVESGSDISSILPYIDSETKNQINNNIKEQFKNMEPSLIKQAAINYIKGEYNAVGYNTSDIQIKYVVIIGIKMLLYTLVVVVITIIISFFTSRISAFFGRDLRSKVTKKVMEFSSKEFKEMSTASLITRCTNDIQQIQNIILMLLRIIIYAPIIGIGAYMKISGSSMAWVIGLAVAMILLLVIVLFSITLPKFQKLQDKIDKINLVSREILTGLPVVRAFANEKYEEERFDEANKDLTKTQLFVNRIMAIMMPTMMFIMNAVSILIIWVGASKVDAGTMQVGTLMAFITYTMQIIMAFLMISLVSIALPRAIISLKRIAEVFNKKTAINEIDNPIKFNDKMHGVVEFKDVYFRYPDADEDLLEDVSFKALPGTTTAILGSTGSGKSTLINLIPRFFDVTGGKILIDGVNIKDVTLHDLRSKIGFVPQKGMLFSGTIETNIGFGKDEITESELIESAKISQSYEFIKRKKDEFNSEISQGGSNVSGGQRQRLAIARAIAIKPEIYIFDDSFSALDYKTDIKLRRELSKITTNSTIFIVAQRISTVLNADQIIVLDDGKVAGIGSHKELLKNCEVYKEIAYSQLQKEELENE